MDHRRGEHRFPRDAELHADRRLPSFARTLRSRGTHGVARPVARRARHLDGDRIARSPLHAGDAAPKRAADTDGASWHSRGRNRRQRRRPDATARAGVRTMAPAARSRESALRSDLQRRRPRARVHLQPHQSARPGRHRLAHECAQSESQPRLRETRRRRDAGDGRGARSVEARSLHRHPRDRRLGLSVRRHVRVERLRLLAAIRTLDALDARAAGQLRFARAGAHPRSADPR